MRIAKHIRLTALFIVAAACGIAYAQGAAYRTVMSTRGDTIVARATGDVPDAQLKRLVPEWRASAELAAADGETIGDVRNMAVGPDGRVYVWDPTTPALWVIDASGKTLKRIGRQGAGPGEYAKDGNGLVVAADGRLKVWDEGNARINIYNADGKFLSSHNLGFSHCCPGGALTADVHNRLWLRVAMGGGFADKDKGPPDLNQVGREVTAYFRTNASGAVVDTVMTKTLPGNTPPVTAIRQSAGGTSMSSMIVPYSTSMIYSVSPLGHIVFGQTRPYVVYTVHNGKPLRIERERVPVPVPSEERAQQRARIEFNHRRIDPEWKWTGIDIPAEKPPILNIFNAQDGRIWVTLNVESEKFTPDPPATKSTTPPPPPVTYRVKERRWDVFERDGRYLGRVVAPRTFGLYVARGNHIWGTMRDENDVPAIVKMRVDLPPALEVKDR